MKTRFILYITVIIMVLTVISGCSNNINGSKILSNEKVKDYNIVSINITFFDEDNRIKSPVAILTKDDKNGKTSIQDFKEIIMKSKGIAFEGQDRFSPASDSSHYIKVVFDNDYELDFYYSLDNNWIIWSNIVEEEDQKILEYHFLNPTLSVEQWLSSIKPLAIPQ